MVLDEADIQINLQKAAGLIFLLGSPKHNSCTGYGIRVVSLKKLSYFREAQLF